MKRRIAKFCRGGGAKALLVTVLLLCVFSLSVPKTAWASYTEYVQSGNWYFKDLVDDFSYVYCDLPLPVNSPNRCDGSLTEVTLTVKCTSAGYTEPWSLDIYRAGKWNGVNGAIPLGQYTATVSGIGNNNVVTATISIPDEGYNGLGFRQHPVEPNWDDDEWYEITVTRIKYRRYTVDGFEPIVTFDRFVFLSVAQSTPVKNIRYIIVRSPGGNTFGAGGKDVNVDPEKYYYYSLYYGFMMDVPWGQPVAATRSVKIPSDATDAKASADAAASRTIYNGQSAAYWAYQASLAAQNPAPTITRVQGLNNATCTTGTTFSVVVQAAGATECRAKVDNGAWTGWVPIGSPVMVTGITLTGAHTIYVEARGSTGATATGQMMMFKL